MSYDACCVRHASGSRAKRQQGDNWLARQAAMNIGDKEAVRHKPIDDEGSGSEEDFRVKMNVILTVIAKMIDSD